MTSRSKILLVDDQTANLHTLSRTLADEFDLSLATSGADALLIAQKVKPDLILLDVMMPGMDGLETVRRLRATDWGMDIPVILVTADDRIETQVCGLELGANDFVAKPIVAPVLKARMHNLLKSRLLQRELHRLATTDSLTGLLNRRRMIEQGGAELLRVVRYGQPCALLMLDLDHFKSINDGYGHAAGDSILVTVSAAVGGLLRETDFFGRIGGEEFAILLPQTDRDGAINLAERLRGVVNDIRLGLPDGRVIGVTVSIGVTHLRDSDSRFEDALVRADAALYAAKAAGRNCVRDEYNVTAL